MKREPLIIDAHAHIGYWPSLLKCENTLLESVKKYNIAFTLVSFDGCEFKNKDNENIRLIPQINAFKKCYKFVSENINFGMLLWIRPCTEKNFHDVETFYTKHSTHIYGIKFHPFCSRLRITSPKLLPYFKIAKKYNLPILVHTATDKYSKLKYLIKVATLNPEINFIAAHLELNSDNLNALDAIKNIPNLYGDTAWVDPKIIPLLVENNLIDKIMFGTDNPIDGLDTLNNPFYQTYINNEYGLSKDNYDKIMCKNAIKIYKISKTKLKN